MKREMHTYYDYDIKIEYHFNWVFPFIHRTEEMIINPKGKYWFIKILPNRTVHSINSPYHK